MLVAALLTALSLLVSPLQSFAPATLTIKLQVEPSPNNCLVRVVVDGEDYFRSTDIELPPGTKKTLPPLTYPRVPAGDYTVTAGLFSCQGELLSKAQRTLVVIGNQ